MTAVNPWVVFAVSSAAVFMVSVDATIAVAAFPALRQSFAEASPTDLSWVLNAYTILYAALLVPAGRLVDLHGSRRLFLIGVTIFTLASAACGIAPGTGSLIAARVVQAVGGAILAPASLALILGAFPPEKRTAIVGMWSGVGALGAAVGPGVGGILIELATWRAAFLINLPFGALIIWYGWRKLPMLGGAARRERLDLIGIGLIVAGVSSLTYGIVQIESLGLVALMVWAPAVTGAILLIGYALWAKGRRNAAIDMALFQDRSYAFVTLATFVFGIGFAMLFLTSFLFLLEIWGFGQGLTGLAVTPGPLVVILVAVTSGRFVTRVGHRAVIVTGGLVFAVGQLILGTQITPTPSYFSLWLPLQIIGGAAVGLLLVGLSGAAVAGLPPSRFGVGGAVNNAVRQVGGVIGTAFAVVLIGQPDTPIAGFQTAFLWIAGLSAITAGIAFGLPSKPRFSESAGASMEGTSVQGKAGQTHAPAP
jgi:EmrB/QacA subfamily drug resistance transporter